MAARGLERCHVDGALNAVGELGDPTASRLVVLLGHIDRQPVPGNIPVRIEDDGSPHGILHGRGSVDAKGPLASFVAAAARLGADWARAHDLRVIVAGATEEEAASSRGAHFLLKRLNGRDEPAPDFCIIGEPSPLAPGDARLQGTPADRPAGPASEQPYRRPGGRRRHHGLRPLAAPGAGRPSATAAGHPSERVLPSLRSIGTTSDGLYDTVRADYGLRLPVELRRCRTGRRADGVVRFSGGGHRRAAVLRPRPGARDRHDSLRAGARRPGTQPARLRDRGSGPTGTRRWSARSLPPFARSAVLRSRRSSSSRPAPAT